MNVFPSHFLSFSYDALGRLSLEGPRPGGAGRKRGGHAPTAAAAAASAGAEALAAPDLIDDIDNLPCMVCGSILWSKEDPFLLCDANGCNRGCHLSCHHPRLAAVPAGDYYCPECQAVAPAAADSQDWPAEIAAAAAGAAAPVPVPGGAAAGKRARAGPGGGEDAPEGAPPKRARCTTWAAGCPSDYSDAADSGDEDDDGGDPDYIPSGPGIASAPPPPPAQRRLAAKAQPAAAPPTGGPSASAAGAPAEAHVGGSHAGAPAPAAAVGGPAEMGGAAMANDWDVFENLEDTLATDAATPGTLIGVPVSAHCGDPGPKSHVYF